MWWKLLFICYGIVVGFFFWFWFVLLVNGVGDDGGVYYDLLIGKFFFCLYFELFVCKFFVFVVRFIFGLVGSKLFNFVLVIFVVGYFDFGEFGFVKWFECLWILRGSCECCGVVGDLRCWWGG